MKQRIIKFLNSKVEAKIEDNVIYAYSVAIYQSLTIDIQLKNSRYMMVFHQIYFNHLYLQKADNLMINQNISPHRVELIRASFKEKLSGFNKAGTMQKQIYAANYTELFDSMKRFQKQINGIVQYAFKQENLKIGDLEKILESFFKTKLNIEFGNLKTEHPLIIFFFLEIICEKCLEKAKQAPGIDIAAYATNIRMIQKKT